MKLRAKDIIKILPFEESLKTQLLDEFDTMDPDRKDDIVNIVWRTYNALYELKLEENIQLALQRAESDQESLDEDFYKRVREQTERELLTEETQKTASVDLKDTREELQKILADPTSH